MFEDQKQVMPGAWGGQAVSSCLLGVAAEPCCCSWRFSSTLLIALVPSAARRDPEPRSSGARS